jgi:DNA-binding transcriptional regulator YhcF (GntR family)
MNLPELQNHWLWQDKPYAKGQAYIDLFLLSVEEKTKTIYRNKIFILAPGQLITSENELCKRWGWSRTKVRSFLRLLEETSMVELQRDKRKTLITVLKHSNIRTKDNQNTPNPTHDLIQDEEQVKMNRTTSDNQDESEGVNRGKGQDGRQFREQQKIQQKVPLKTGNAPEIWQKSIFDEIAEE